MQIMGKFVVESEFGVCDTKQTADGRHYSEQHGRNAEKPCEAGAARGFACSTRRVGVASGNRARRAAAATASSSEFLPNCKLQFLPSAVCCLSYTLHL
jgi:hypothetical protein